MKKAMIVISLLMLICGCAKQQGKPAWLRDSEPKQMFRIGDSESSDLRVYGMSSMSAYFGEYKEN
jgi:hypothetical protein